MAVFGIGAGLRPGELVALRGGDVFRHGRQVMVQVGGPPARVVPVTSRYARRAWELARRAGSGFVFRPGPADRSYKNFVTNFARGLAADPAAPALSMRQARSSFICGHLAAGTPVCACCSPVTGIAGAGSLARYARRASSLLCELGQSLSFCYITVVSFRRPGQTGTRSGNVTANAFMAAFQP